MHNRRKWHLFSLAIVLLIAITFYSASINDMIFKNEIKLLLNENQTLKLGYPFNLNDEKIDSNIAQLSVKDKKGSYTVSPIDIGTTDIELNLFGLIPIRNIKVNVIPKTKLIPGGQSVGVRLNTKGVLIVGLEEFESVDGRKCNPGENAGLSVGDSILNINGTKVKNAEHVIELINVSKNKQVKLKVKRKDKTFEATIIPEKSKSDGEYRMGLWVRDKTAGVGTLTFYDPNSKKFGALGHAITDIDTGLLLTIDNGEVVRSKVASIQQGKRGKPGEIKGIFYETSKPIGSLEKNTHYGIYGNAYTPIKNPLYNEAIEIAYQDQIREGKAEILTTLDNDKLESYDIYIEKVNRQRSQSTKSMIIRVVDERLLKKSGGIVQGMSGSPIIQDGKLIGAVTHVFVNDPTKGYGLFIEWMLEEAEIDIYNNSKLATNN